MSVYLDYNATTPLRPEVFDAMRPFLMENFGNASSLHSFGRAARQAIEAARTQIAYAVDAAPDEIVFTSGATEANNFVLKSFAQHSFLISEIEHPSLIQPAWQMAQNGAELSFLTPNNQGEITTQALQIALSQKKADFCTVMAANNETGVINDIVALAEIFHKVNPKGVFHADCVQALGKIELSFHTFKQAGGASMALSAHKIGGPQGIGALVYRRDVDLNPLIAGGGQEQGLRSGTENVAAIVGFGMAAAIAAAKQKEYHAHTLELRTLLEEGLQKQGATIFGQNASHRLPNTLYFAFPNIDGATLLSHLDALGFALGSGSACGSGKTRASVVLKAMHVAPDLSQSAVRVSLGTQNTKEHIHHFLMALNKTHTRLRNLCCI